MGEAGGGFKCGRHSIDPLSFPRLVPLATIQLALLEASGRLPTAALHALGASFLAGRAARVADGLCDGGRVRAVGHAVASKNVDLAVLGVASALLVGTGVGA